jgi:DNA modification methylase
MAKKKETNPTPGITIERFDMALSELELNPNNPRIITDEAMQNLIQSIKEDPEYLQARPVVASDRTGKNIIIGGNQRFKAVGIMKHKTVPTIIMHGLTEDDEVRIMFKDNADNFGQWDTEMIASMNWEELLLDNPQFGINTDFIQTEPEDIIEDEPENVEGVTTDIEPGDIFEIGGGRLMCGDSTSQEEVEKLMDGKKADMCYTDPPYGVSYVGVNNPNGKKWDMIKNDDLRDKDLFSFLAAAFKNLYYFTKDNIAAYIWYASTNHVEFETALEDAGFKVRQQLIWNKGMILGHSDYHWAHEPVLYCAKQGQKTTWYGDRTYKTILSAKRTEISKFKKEELVQIFMNMMTASTNWEIDRDSVVTYVHPNQKPVTLAARAINNSSKTGDIILDLFGGSGGTMSGCEQLDRVCYMMEKDPKYCQVIIDRLRKLKPEIQIKKL